jgi:hypothetical protein
MFIKANYILTVEEHAVRATKCSSMISDRLRSGRTRKRS